MALDRSCPQLQSQSEGQSQHSGEPREDGSLSPTSAQRAAATSTLPWTPHWPSLGHKATEPLGGPHHRSGLPTGSPEAGLPKATQGTVLLPGQEGPGQRPSSLGLVVALTRPQHRSSRQPVYLGLSQDVPLLGIRFPTWPVASAGSSDQTSGQGECSSEQGLKASMWPAGQAWPPSDLTGHSQRVFYHGHRATEVGSLDTPSCSSGV